MLPLFVGLADIKNSSQSQHSFLRKSRCQRTIPLRFRFGRIYWPLMTSGYSPSYQQLLRRCNSFVQGVPLQWPQRPSTACGKPLQRPPGPVSPPSGPHRPCTGQVPYAQNADLNPLGRSKSFIFSSASCHHDVPEICSAASFRLPAKYLPRAMPS